MPFSRLAAVGEETLPSLASWTLGLEDRTVQVVTEVELHQRRELEAQLLARASPETHPTNLCLSQHVKRSRKRPLGKRRLSILHRPS
jgi:hypothetical protein